MRIFAPLKPDHPLVQDADICPLCKSAFKAGERVVLRPARDPIEGVETVPGIPVHAHCALRGMKTPKGIIQKVKHGDGSPFCIETSEGQFKPSEVGLSD